MQTVLTTVYRISILIFASLVCCLSCKKVHTAKENTSGIDGVAFQDETVQQMYGQYLKIQTALVEDSPKIVQQEAKILAGKIPDTKEYQSFKATTKLLYLTKGIKKQRDFFVGITLQMEAIIKASPIQSGQVYKQFCPMAFDGAGGYWLSNTEEIRNPFFGHQMLHCGTTDEVIE